MAVKAGQPRAGGEREARHKFHFEDFILGEKNITDVQEESKASIVLHLCRIVHKVNRGKKPFKCLIIDLD